MVVLLPWQRYEYVRDSFSIYGAVFCLAVMQPGMREAAKLRMDKGEVRRGVMIWEKVMIMGVKKV